MLHPTAQEIAHQVAHANDDRRPIFIAANVVFLVLAFVAVGLRFFARRKSKTPLGWDDWLICLAAALLTGHVTCLLWCVRLGMGRHTIYITDVKGFLITSLFAETFYNLSIPATKLSILALYRRIFSRATGWFTATLNCTALFVILYTIPQCFTYVFRCVPVESLWTEYGPGTKVTCVNFQAIMVSFGIINIITDWFILLLPLPVLLGLKLERRAKWSICVLFLLGGLVCIVSIIRLLYARKPDSIDPSWDSIPIAAISTIEGSFGILAACLPTWRPLFRFLRHGLTSFLNPGSKPESKPGTESDLQRAPSSFSRPRRWSTRLQNMGRSQVTGGLVYKTKDLDMDTRNLPERSETSMSESSVAKILVIPAPDSEVELGNSKSMPDFSNINPNRRESSHHQTKPELIDFGVLSPNYHVTAEADRWEGLIKQQGVRTEPRRFGDVAYGGGGWAPAQGSKKEETGGGILVTKTVTSVSNESG